jgi:diguanylate cyclase (GGDEF)-like protein/PAS domain S-box-containing protein
VWRQSVAGLSAQLRLGASLFQEVPESDSDKDYSQDPIAAFGIAEARKHQGRGVSLTIFLGLMKYHRQSYRDYIDATFKEVETRSGYTMFTDRCFDRMELGIICAWSKGQQSDITEELGATNLAISLEKNHYLTIFESLPHPVFLSDETGAILTFNCAAAEAFSDLKSVGSQPSGLAATDPGLPWMPSLIQQASQHEHTHTFITEHALSTRQGERIFSTCVKKSLDISGKVSSYIVILSDMTERKAAQQRVFRLSRAYDVLSQTSQAIVRYKTSTMLFKAICCIAVKNGHLKMALINRVHPETKRVRTVAADGGSPSCMSSTEPPHSRPHITALVADTQRPYICNDIRQDPWLHSRTGEAAKKNFRALACFPLHCKNSLYGTLNLYAAEQDFFTPDIVTVFEEMAADISFALDNFERERQRQRAEEKLWETSNKLHAIFQAAPLPVVAHTLAGKVLMWNPEAEKIFGWKEKELLNRPLPTVSQDHMPEFLEKNQRVLAGESIDRLHVQRHTRDGQLRDFLLFNTPLYGPQQNIYAIMAVLMDITDQKKAQEQIVYLAHHDHLTQLPNRTLLKERFAQAAAHAQRSDTGLALCVLDLDGFKYVNDLLGHHLGDQLLCLIAERLQNGIRRADTVCRMGGDEFLILLGDIRDISALGPLLRKISAVFSTPFILNGHQWHVTMSIGVAMFGEDGTDFDTLFKHADAAMYFAKKAGGNHVEYFRKEIGCQIQQRFHIEKGLREALSEQAFTMNYQPICAVSDNAIIGAEALIRWHHPTRGWVPPAQFIPIAEEANLIIPLGTWILDEVCRTLRTWDDRGLPPMPVAVNISAKQIFDQAFPALVAHTLKKYNLSPHRLELEVTEGIFLENVASVESIMQALKAIGVGLALDDFGTGYSSLSYLKRFRIDKLKIDRCFMQDVCHQEQDAVLAETIILMARSLGLKAVAEGIETPEQLAFLQKCRCEFYQGYLCTPPLPPEAFVTFLENSRKNQLFGYSVGV